MSKVSLLPRLASVHVEELLVSYRNHEQFQIAGKEYFQSDEQRCHFAASGGSPDWMASLDIASGLREVARGLGFPESSSAKARAEFDMRATVMLACDKRLDTGEALRDDVWAFISVVLAPDVVAWRFTDKGDHRFRGGVRNAFQRLWTRGAALDRGESSANRWLLVQELTEDAMVQIFERASIASNDRLARAIAEAWVTVASEKGRSIMEDVMRRSIKLIRIRLELLDLTVLSDSLLQLEVISIFKSTLKGMHTKEI
jgi:hypothetical protein